MNLKKIIKEKNLTNKIKKKKKLKNSFSIKISFIKK